MCLPAETKKNPDQSPAHALWVELATRIATQRLHYRSGDEETAADSIFSLFKKTRELLEKNPDAKAFGELALTLLNTTLRSNTARWHGWMTQDKSERDKDGKPVLKFKDEWVRRQFRRELGALQPRLVGFKEAFEAMKNGQTPAAWLTDPTDAELITLRNKIDRPATANLGQDLVAEIKHQVIIALPKAKNRELAKLDAEQRKQAEVNEQETLINKINEAERKEIFSRRGETEKPSLNNATALAFSGGGIRSATFCLGITQVLARRGLLRQFDYMSTVSGGGYFGSFISAYLGTDDQPQAPANPLKKNATEMIQRMFVPEDNQREPRLLRHLRNRSRYLVDDGFIRKSMEVALVAAGILFNLLIVLPVPLIGALLTVWVFHSGFLGDYNWITEPQHCLPAPSATISVGTKWLLAATAVWLLIYSGVKSRSQRILANEQRNSKMLIGWQYVFAAMSITAVVGLLCWLLPAEFRAYHWLKTGRLLAWLGQVKEHSEKILAVSGLTLTTLLGALALRLKNNPGSAGMLKPLAMLSGPLLYLAIYFAAAYRMLPTDQPPKWDWQIVLTVTVITTALTWVFVNVNTFSPHGYYRDRLSECYLQATKQAGSNKDEPKDGLRLSKLNPLATAPYHLINVTVNLPSSKLREMRGRNGDFFMISKNYCGSPMCGYYPTKELEDADPHFNLGTAMAVSGAAASSNMGWQTNNSIRLILTLANVRLGYWLRNPWVGAAETKAMCGPGPLQLFREMFAKGMDEKRHFINLSDGGHIENLAAYELLRRRCKFILCVDGGMEPDMECTDLLRLERYAAIDLGIKMHYDLTDLKLQSNGYCRAYGVLVKIDYDPPSDETKRRKREPEELKWGWMLYIKLAMIGYGPGYVMDYKREHPDFPHQTTANQIYDEAQFEAYRALGEAAAESFFHPEFIETIQEINKDVAKSENSSPEKDIKVKDWFAALATNLLPDNDEAFRKT